MREELIKKFESLLEGGIGENTSELKTIQKDYQKAWSNEFEEAKQNYINDGGKAREFVFEKDNLDNKFDELVSKYKKLKKEYDSRLANEQEKNLAVKETIIQQISDLSRLSENVGAAVKKLKELQDEWKESGAVSPHKYKDIQAKYSQAVEEFYYNLKIYRDLQEHDLKKNLELKSELILKVKALLENENTKEIEHSVRVFRNEWDEIGPVPNEKWEDLKQEYRSAVDAVYEKIKGFYKNQEELKKENALLKKGLIENLIQITEKLPFTSIKDWNKNTESVIKLQTDWKEIGRTTEKDNAKLWEEFRKYCDLFFDSKKDFYAGLQGKHIENRKVKEKLIEKADALKKSTDWIRTSKELIKLQEEWKKHPANGDREEPKLYAKFREACNYFFESKKNHFEKMEASLIDNLQAKEQLLSEFKAFNLSGETKSDREALNGFIAKWNQAGKVPSKEVKRINDSFYSLFNEYLEKIGISQNEKQNIQFQAKIDRFAASENAKDLLSKEADFLKKQINEINSTLNTFENNMGFFKNAKGGEKLLVEAESKLKAEKDKLALFSERRQKVIQLIKNLRESVES
ncbi:MAG: DUF349 domain-containing protein [Bacteroidia bacterium]